VVGPTDGQTDDNGGDGRGALPSAGPYPLITAPVSPNYRLLALFKTGRSTERGSAIASSEPSRRPPLGRSAKVSEIFPISDYDRHFCACMRAVRCGAVCV